ncbi:MAG: GAF domain-containing protein [Bryobacteraceae bacterium]
MKLPLAMRKAIAESAVLIAAMLAAGWLFGAGPRLEGIQPHPFWIVVLIAAAQYGTPAGLAAAALATVALRVFHLPDAGFDYDRYAWLWQTVREPLGWFLAGGAFGALRSRALGREEELAVRAREAADREREYAEAWERNEAVKKKLEETVAANLRSAVTLYLAAQEVEKLDPLDVLHGAQSMVAAGLSPDRFSLYLLDGRRLIGVLRQGWPDEAPFPWTCDASSTLYREVIGNKRTLCAARPGDREALGGEAVLAGPLVVEETGETIGMLKIEEAGFPSLNLSAIQNFEVICRWIASAYSKALRYQDSHLSQAFNTRTGILSHAFYEQQSLFMTRVAQRLGFPLTTLSVRLTNAGELHETERAMVASVLGSAVQSALRGIDLAFEGDRPGAAYAILLANTNGSGARVVGRKIESELRQRLTGSTLRARFSLRMASLHDPPPPRPDGESLEAMSHAVVAAEPERFSAAIARMREVWRG